MASNNENKKDKTKQYQLTADEQINLSARKGIYRHQKYVADMMLTAIELDMEDFVNNTVKKRLGIPKEQVVLLDVESGTLKLEEKKEEPEKEAKPVILGTDGKPT